MLIDLRDKGDNIAPFFSFSGCIIVLPAAALNLGTDCNDWKMKWRLRVQADPENIKQLINTALGFAWSH